MLCCTCYRSLFSSATEARQCIIVRACSKHALGPRCRCTQNLRTTNQPLSLAMLTP